VAKCVPRLVVQKAKTHLLVHMPMFVRRFGPLLGPSSERYESFNSTFRAASVHSNRQAPSRDIARTFATFDMVKHIILGGYWLDEQTQQYIHAGTSVTEFCASSRFTQRLLGIKPSKNISGEFLYATCNGISMNLRIRSFKSTRIYWLRSWPLGAIRT
jgi:hypothetical protein